MQIFRWHIPCSRNPIRRSIQTKRGRFNIGEKNVLAVCDEAKITSTTGQIVFHRNGTRTTNSTKTKVGSEFYGILDLTDSEYNLVVKQVSGLFPPIKTFFNGIEIPIRKPFHIFEAILPTEIADENGILRSRRRKTEIRVYNPKLGEISSIYEEGIPVVTIESKWHIDIQQKIPLNTERDNVTPSYLKTIRVTVMNEMSEHITEDDATQGWVSSALEDKRINKKATGTIMDKRYGKKRASYDPSDIGSNKEVMSKDYKLVHGGALPKKAWGTRQHQPRTPAGQICPTNADNTPPKVVVSPEGYTNDEKRYVELIETTSPILINHNVQVKIIDDLDLKIRGCTRWTKKSTETVPGVFIFEINRAFHNCSDWDGNYYLLLHELAHHAVQSK